MNKKESRENICQYFTIDSREELKMWLEEERKIYKPHKMWWLSSFWCENDLLWKFQRKLRKCEYYTNTGKNIRKIYTRIIYKHMCLKYGMHIGINCCGKGLRIMHLGNILMNSATRLGMNCMIHINTCFVAGGTSNKTPHVGNGVVVGVNSILCGDVYLADDIAVGAGSFVNASFYEKNIGIAGSPAKKISGNGRVQWENSKNTEEK